jgi:hypothetical protein
VGNGNVQNSNNSYTGISDIKLKENIVTTPNGTDIKALKFVTTTSKAKPRPKLGLVAQEVEQCFPGLVSESRPDEKADLTVTKSVNYSVLYMKAVKALQEAMERIETPGSCCYSSQAP